MLTTNQTLQSESISVNKFGLFCSVSVALITVVTFVIAFLTPPLSGPLCIAKDCLQYPYTDIASRFPRDYIWMYPAMLLMIFYVMFVVSIHFAALHSKRIFTSLAVIFSSMSAFTIIMDYFIQVSVIQPSLLNKEYDGISILSQYNPHGIFIVMEELGFLLMSISFLFLFLASTGNSKIEKSLRWTYLAGFVLAIAGLIFFTVQYGVMREYVFEIYVISVVWIVLIIAGILQAFNFLKSIKAQTNS